jgi:hypothetical protein
MALRAGMHTFGGIVADLKNRELMYINGKAGFFCGIKRLCY